MSYLKFLVVHSFGMFNPQTPDDFPLTGFTLGEFVDIF